ncbi:MAG: hypothetical protein ABSF54_22895 [Bryobacteraceae bacterium]|jgi:hypothetical protein
MTIFTIDHENSITAFATAGAAAAASTTPFDLFTDQKELAELLVGWPAERLVATYNSLPGVKPVKALPDPNTAARKIWERVAKLGQMAAPEPVAAPPNPNRRPRSQRPQAGPLLPHRRALLKGKATKRRPQLNPSPRPRRRPKHRNRGRALVARWPR